MPCVAITRTLHAPIQSVWDSLNDIDHTPDWVVGLERAERVTTGPYGLNSLYCDYNRLGPFPQATRWLVTEFDPMTRQTHVSESKALPSTIRFSLAAVPDGTQVEMSVEYRLLPALGPFSRLLESLFMNRALTQVIDQNLANLERHLAG